MRIGIRLDLVILQTTDRAVDFQHRQSNLVILPNPMLAQRALQLIHADMLLRHVRFDNLSVVNQQAGFPLNEAPEAAICSRKVGDKIVKKKQRTRSHHPAQQRSVRPSHGILHRIGEEQQKGEIERRHLSNLTLPAEANSDQDQQVNHAGAQDNLKQHVATGRKESLFQLAVTETGAGALFGVLRYPVALFFSTFHTTSSKSR